MVVQRALIWHWSVEIQYGEELFWLHEAEVAVMVVLNELMIMMDIYTETLLSNSKKTARFWKFQNNLVKILFSESVLVFICTLIQIRTMASAAQMISNISSVRNDLVNALSFRVWKILNLGIAIAERIFISQLWNTLLCGKETFCLL